MPTPTAAERLHALQQKNRKAAGLPDPSEYKKKLDAMKSEEVNIGDKVSFDHPMTAVPGKTMKKVGTVHKIEGDTAHVKVKDKYGVMTHKKNASELKKENYEEDDGPLSQEQLDEISDKLKSSYVSGAKKQIKQSLPFTKKTDEYRDIAKNFIAKRQKGIAKANEEVELNESEDKANARKMYHKHFVASMKSMASSSKQKHHQAEMAKYKAMMGDSFVDQVAPKKFAKFDKKTNEEVELLDEMPESSMKTRDVHSHLKKAGWALARSSGGHDVYKHPKAKHSIPVPRHNQLKAPLIRGIMKASKVEESFRIGGMGSRGANVHMYDRNPGPKDGSELENVPFHAKTEKQKKLQNALNDLGKKMKETHPKLREDYDDPITVIKKGTNIKKKINADAYNVFKQHGFRKEANDPQEYDYEGDMAKSDLRSIMHHAKELHDMLDDDTNLAEWCQSKITLAEDYLSTVANYMRSEMDEETMQEDINDYQRKIDKNNKNFAAATKRQKNPLSNKKVLQGADFAAQRRKERLASSGRMDEGRASQRHPLEGHEYHKKSNEALVHIAKDAHAAAEAMKSHNPQAENKYRDQANDSATVRHFRKTSGMPDWYKKKYGHVNESSHDAPFNKPYNKDSGTTTDKSGAKHTPMSKARHLARQAMNKTADKPVKESASEPTEGEMKGKQGYSRKAQIVRDAAGKGKKSDNPDKFQKDPELSSEIHKT